MRIIIDTNVVMSGVFFSGIPSFILKAFNNATYDVYANDDIIAEYEEVYERLKQKLHRTPQTDLFHTFIDKLNIADTKSNIAICRDPDDDKFLNCAIDTNSLYIVSGDRDLLDIQKFRNTTIITATEFYEKYLAEGV